MATHFSVLAWIIPGMGEPGGLPSTGSHIVGHDLSNLAAAEGLKKKKKKTKTAVFGSVRNEESLKIFEKGSHTIKAMLPEDNTGNGMKENK